MVERFIGNQVLTVSWDVRLTQWFTAMQTNKTAAETIIALDNPLEKAAGSVLVIMAPNTATPITPPSCLADAINPDAMPASCEDTDASIELVIEGTDEALPMPTTIRAIFRYQSDVSGVTRASARKPTA